MSRAQLIAYVTLALVVLYLGVTLITRMQEGRCRPGGRRGGIDCTYPAGSMRPVQPTWR